ncbi:MAG: hypothetical protein IJN19_01200 [Opitutales bacterium]|nr:hypothetical protein [Opitutales bacterium]
MLKPLENLKFPESQNTSDSQPLETSSIEEHVWLGKWLEWCFGALVAKCAVIQNADFDSLKNKISEVDEVLIQLRDFSVEKEKELRRWRECYDQRILRNFLTRIADVVGNFDIKIASLKKQGGEACRIEDLDFMRTCLLDALDGEGFVTFGEEYIGQKMEGASTAEIKFILEETDNPALENYVFAMEERGFKLYDGNGEKLIQAVSLRRYKLSAAKKSENFA